MEKRYEQTLTIERTTHYVVSAESPVERAGNTPLLSPVAVLPEQFYARTTENFHPASGVRALVGAHWCDEDRTRARKRPTRFRLRLGQ